MEESLAEGPILNLVLDKIPLDDLVDEPDKFKDELVVGLDKSDFEKTYELDGNYYKQVVEKCVFFRLAGIITEAAEGAGFSLTAIRGKRRFEILNKPDWIADSTQFATWSDLNTIIPSTDVLQWKNILSQFGLATEDLQERISRDTFVLFVLCAKHGGVQEAVAAIREKASESPEQETQYRYLLGHHGETILENLRTDPAVVHASLPVEDEESVPANKREPQDTSGLDLSTRETSVITATPLLEAKRLGATPEKVAEGVATIADKPDESAVEISDSDGQDASETLVVPAPLSETEVLSATQTETQVIESLDVPPDVLKRWVAILVQKGLLSNGVQNGEYSEHDIALLTAMQEVAVTPAVKDEAEPPAESKGDFIATDSLGGEGTMAVAVEQHLPETALPQSEIPTPPEGFTGDVKTRVFELFEEVVYGEDASADVLTLKQMFIEHASAGSREDAALVWLAIMNMETIQNPNGSGEATLTKHKAFISEGLNAFIENFENPGNPNMVSYGFSKTATKYGLKPILLFARIRRVASTDSEAEAGSSKDPFQTVRKALEQMDRDIKVFERLPDSVPEDVTCGNEQNFDLAYGEFLSRLIRQDEAEAYVTDQTEVLLSNWEQMDKVSPDLVRSFSDNLVGIIKCVNADTGKSLVQKLNILNRSLHEKEVLSEVNRLLSERLGVEVTEKGAGIQLTKSPVEFLKGLAVALGISDDDSGPAGVQMLSVLQKFRPTKK